MIPKATLSRLIKFGFVGVIGLLVDMVIVHIATVWCGLDPYTARVISFIAAATTTWFGNRILTFADRPKHSPSKQWLKFLVANAPGIIVNNSVYALLVGLFPYIYGHPLWAVAAGSLSGMLFNYVASSRFVFPAT